MVRWFSTPLKNISHSFSLFCQMSARQPFGRADVVTACVPAGYRPSSCARPQNSHVDLSKVRRTRCTRHMSSKPAIQCFCAAQLSPNGQCGGPESYCGAIRDACCSGNETWHALLNLVKYWENHLAFLWKLSGGWPRPPFHCLLLTWYQGPMFGTFNQASK